MQYLIGFDEVSATARSLEIAEAHGSGGEITKYFFGWMEKQDGSDWALLIPTGYASELTDEEQAALKTKTYMIDNNWFPPSILP